MRKQIVIIGLGQFGLSVARALSRQGVEVLAVDIDENRVKEASAFVAEAVRMDVTEVSRLQRISPAKRDVCVCAIGDVSKDASIICTTLLRQLGAPRVVARANDEVHSRILKLVGAHQVVNPEHDFGERFATQLVHERVLGEMTLGSGVLISEIAVPTQFVGQGLAALALPKRYGVTVVAIRRAADGGVALPDATTTIGEGDILVVVGGEGAVTKMLESGE